MVLTQTMGFVLKLNQTISAVKTENWKLKINLQNKEIKSFNISVVCSDNYSGGLVQSRDMNA